SSQKTMGLSADYRSLFHESGGECRSRTCPTRRSRRVSTAVPCRSANSPLVDMPLSKCRNGVHDAIRTRSLRLRTPPLWSIELRGRIRGQVSVFSNQKTVAFSDY